MTSRYALLVAGSLLAFAPVCFAQNVKDSGAANPATGQVNNQTEKGPQSGQTGVGTRGTKVAPSTTPGQPNQPATAETGVEPRGTKVAPSTNPGQSGQQTH